MQNESNPTGPAEYIATVKDRIQTGPIPNWVVGCSYSLQFKAEDHAPITHLLQNTQVHAEKRELFVQNAIRLETMDAVQHFSQWRLQFEPKTQLVTLHTLKIRRGETETNHLKLEKAHILQREEGLEKFVILGWFTFLMILEDVRPGDILEFAYTIQTQPLLLPDNGSYFFTLPQAVSVGKYHFTVQFAATRQMKWKSLDSNLKPVENRADAMVCWKWEGENYAGSKPEKYMPAWHLAFPWIQISDFPDWKTIATAVAEAWTGGNHDEAIAAMVLDIEKAEIDIPARIEKALRLIQDEYRYFSVNLEFGGQVPTAPETVIQRRFGDCKDLSWLLSNLLKKLGVQSRPVLVNTIWRKTIGDLLPTPSLFNHVIVEFELDGKKRWIDTTLKQQGGGPFNRNILDFGFGLPVDNNVDNLFTQPQIPARSDLYELRETILLNTRGGISHLAVTQESGGQFADNLRRQLATVGLEELARQRVGSTTGRFREARRIGTLQFRDDRDNNQFVVAEVFEFRASLGDHPNEKLCRFQIPTDWIANAFAMPEKGERKTPFALPNPSRISHILNIESPAMQRIQIDDPGSRLSNQFLDFSRSVKTGHECLQEKLLIEIKKDSVPADQVEQHGKFVEQIWRATHRELSLPKGYSAPLKNRSFGELPPAAKKLSPLTPTAPLAEPAQTSKPDRRKPVVRRRKHKEYARQNFPVWLKILLRLAIGLGIGLAIFAAHGPHR